MGRPKIPAPPPIVMPKPVGPSKDQLEADRLQVERLQREKADFERQKKEQADLKKAKGKANFGSLTGGGGSIEKSGYSSLLG